MPNSVDKHKPLPSGLFILPEGTTTKQEVIRRLEDLAHKVTDAGERKVVEKATEEVRKNGDD